MSSLPKDSLLIKHPLDEAAESLQLVKRSVQPSGFGTPRPALGYAAVYKLDSEPLDRFVKRKGGINACAARFTRALGRGALRRTAD